MTGKKPRGRPSGYSAEMADRICALIIEGRSLRQIALEEGLPGKSTILRWLGEHEAFRDRYARAMEIRADAMADELVEISDDGTNDWMEIEGRDGGSIGWKVNGEAVQRSRLRVDTRKWLMAKMQPKKYGERVDFNHQGELKLGIADVLQAIDGRTRGLPNGR